MNSINFVAGAPIEAAHLNLESQYTQEAIKSQFLDTYTYGVVIDKSPNQIVYTDGQSLGIYGLVAYDVYGNRIEIPQVQAESDGTAAPALSGLKPDDNMKLIQGGNDLLPQTSYTLIIRYAEFKTDPVVHNVVTCEPSLIGVQASYELYLRSIGGTLEGDIVLANIYVDYVDGTSEITRIDETVKDVSHILDSAVVATIIDNTDENRTTNYNIGDTVSFSQHVHALGTGVVSSSNPHALSAADLGIDLSATVNHQKLLHVNGIRSNNIDSRVSAMYPHYNRESASDYETIYIEPLLDSLEELAVINGVSIFPRDFATQYSYSFKARASQENIGYYIFSYNIESKQITMNGPYESETADGFVQTLNKTFLFPICSFLFDYVSYNVNGTGTAIAYTYDIVPATFKDRRIFNNNSLKNFRPDEAFALTQFAPVANDKAYLHNVSVVSNKVQTKFANLANRQFSITIDGTPITMVFAGNSDNPIPAEEVVTQLIQAFTAVDEDGYTYLRAYPRIIAEDSGNSDAGKLSISAPSSISIDPTYDAAEILGFTNVSNNLNATSDGMIKEMIYYGERNGFIEFVYNDDLDIKQINYFFGGGKVRRNKFYYKDGYITRVDEIVEAL